MSAAVGANQPLGAFSVTSSGSFLESQGITAQTVSVNAANGVTFNGSVTTTGAVNVNADTDANGSGTFTVGSLAAVSTGSQAINITAGDLTLAGTLDSGSATTTIQTAEAETIGIGSAGGSLVITSQELSNITAATLVVGGTTTTSITVSTVDQPVYTANIGLLTLDALTNGGKITFSNTASKFQALSANADNGISVQTNLTTTTGDLSLNGDADNAPASVSPVDNIGFVAGITLTSAGSITLQAQTGGMDGSGTLDLDAANGVTLDSSLASSGAADHQRRHGRGRNGNVHSRQRGGRQHDQQGDQHHGGRHDADRDAQQRDGDDDDPGLRQRDDRVGKAAGTTPCLDDDETGRSPPSAWTFGGSRRPELRWTPPRRPRNRDW